MGRIKRSGVTWICITQMSPAGERRTLSGSTLVLPRLLNSVLTLETLPTCRSQLTHGKLSSLLILYQLDLIEATLQTFGQTLFSTIARRGKLQRVSLKLTMMIFKTSETNLTFVDFNSNHVSNYRSNRPFQNISSCTYMVTSFNIEVTNTYSDKNSFRHNAVIPRGAF